jgi:sigma-B regulation protein RsbU (phosphoserine phosphatase)
MASDFPLDVKALLTVLDHLNLGVYVTDTKRRILLWNRKAEEITGHKGRDVVGKHCHDNVLVHIDKDGRRLCITRFCPLYHSIKLNKESDAPVLVFARKADGSRVVVSVETAPLRDAGGKVVGGIETFRDETSQVRDMEFARLVQQHIMPERLPAVPGFLFDVRYYPHDLLGGDFYDVREVAPGKFGFMVADVRGHGVSAALYTMCLKTISQSLAGVAESPEAFMTAMNRELSRFIFDESFATAFYGVLDVARAEVRYSNAGHPVPMHCSASSGTVAPLEVHGTPLGVVADATYDACAITLQPGHLLLCYTDGLTEAVDKKGKMLGQDGLAELLRKWYPKGKGHLLDGLYRHVKAHCGSYALPDDVLLLSISRSGNSQG